MFLLVFPCFFRWRKQIPSPLPPPPSGSLPREGGGRGRYLLPLEGVRGVEPSFWEGLGRLFKACRFRLRRCHHRQRYRLLLSLRYPHQARGMPQYRCRSLNERGCTPCRPCTLPPLCWRKGVTVKTRVSCRQSCEREPEGERV